MKRIIKFWIIASLLFSCQTSTKQEEIKTNTLTGELINQNNTKNVSQIVEFIDSLYDLSNSNLIDTIINWDILKEKKSKLGPELLDLTNLNEYFKYVSFDFLIFKDKDSAKKQFDKIIEAIETKPEYIDGTGHLFWSLFTKAGATYIFYDNMIIYHDRRCNYDEKIEIPREEKLLEFIFDNKLPEDIYFARARCSWSNIEIK